MKRTWIGRLGAALLAAALLAGCGGSSGAVANGSASGVAYDTAAAEEAPMASPAEVAMADAGGLGGVLESGIEPDLTTDRKIIYNAYMHMETQAFDEAREALRTAMEEAGGYLESTELSGSAEDGNRSLYYTVRVPVAHYSSFLTAAGQAGSLLSLSENTSDITSSYIDVQARLDSLEAQRDRLNELAAAAETTADLIEIETRLGEVQYELESYTRQLRSMDDQVDYSTVNISLDEVKVLTPITHTFADRIIEAFYGGWRGFGAFLQDLAVALVYLLPVLLLAALVIAVVRAATARTRAARKAARAAAKAAPPAPAAYEAPSEAASPAPPDETPKPKY